MTGPLPDGLDPAPLAPRRDEIVEGLRAYIRQLDVEKDRAQAALHSLMAQRRRHGVDRGPADGTYQMMRRYIATLHASGYDGDIMAVPAAEWMLARGWHTTALDPRKAAANALFTMARFGELRWVSRGRYREMGGQEDE